MAPIRYLSDTALLELRANIDAHIPRYLNGDFRDLACQPSWDVPLTIEFDPEILAQLDVTQQQNITQIDIANSKTVGMALASLTPALANEERIWVRLSHVEALEYSRKRWLSGKQGDALTNAIKIHCFAETQTRVRDDHSISRLWWNWYIAKTCWPDAPERALGLILKTADIRSNFVERVWLTSRQALASATLRAMDSEPWVTLTEANFRNFMKQINQFGGGLVFEALDQSQCDAFIADCVKHARLV